MEYKKGGKVYSPAPPTKERRKLWTYRKHPITGIRNHLVATAILKEYFHLALRFDAPDHRELDSVASWIRAKIWLRSKGLPGNPIIEGVEESNLVDRVHGFVGSPDDGNILTR